MFTGNSLIHYEQERGYIFMGLCRCKVYDRHFVPQCSQCYGFDQFAYNCPNKTYTARFAKCSVQHKTDNCRSKKLKCLKCLKVKLYGSKDHEGTSCICLILTKEQNQIQKRTNCSHEKNQSSLVSPKVAFGSAYSTHIP